jgi:hypothetical protein
MFSTPMETDPKSVQAAATATGLNRTIQRRAENVRHTGKNTLIGTYLTYFPET